MYWGGEKMINLYIESFKVKKIMICQLSFMVIFFNMRYCEFSGRGRTIEIFKHWTICLASKSFTKNV